MINRLLTLIMLSILALSLSHAAFAVDLKDPGLISTTYTAEDFYSSDGSVDNSNHNASIILEGTNTFGGTGSAGYSLYLTKIDTASGATSITIASGDTGSSRGVHLSVGNLTASTGSPLTVNIDASASSADAARNWLIVDSLDQNGEVTMNVGSNSLFVMNNVLSQAGTGKFVLDLNSGQAALTKGGILSNGLIGGYGDLAVGTGLTVAGTVAGDAVFSVASGQTLNVVKQLGSAVGGKLTFGGTTKFATLDIQGALNAGDIVVNAGVAMNATTGEINTGTLTVKGNFTETANVDVLASGLTTVDKGITYTVMGTGDVFSGGINLPGILASDPTANTKITLGANANSLAAIAVAGGKIKAGSNTFTIDYANIVITSGTGTPEAAALDAVDGTLDLATSNVTVNLARNKDTIFNVDQNIDINNYAQVSGAVNLANTTAGGGTMSVSGSAVIGNASATARVALNLGQDTNALFEKGLTLDNYGALVATGSGTNVTIGSAGESGDLILLGNNALLGVTDTLTLNSAGTTHRLSVSGAGNTAHGEIDATDFDLIVNAASVLNVAGGTPGLGLSVASASVRGRLDLGDTALLGGNLTSASDVHVYAGGSIVANHDTATITGGGLSAALTVDRGGFFAMETADVVTSGFGSVTLNGSFTAGWIGPVLGGTSTTLIADSPVTIGKNGSISVTNDLARNATGGEVLIDTTTAGLNTLTNNANSSYKSIYGNLEFEVTNNGQWLEIVGVSNQLTGNRNTDIPIALANLREMWCPGLIRDDFGTLVYDVMEGHVVAADTEAGNKNAALFDAIGNPDAKNVGKSTLDYMSGAHLHGITDVAVETSRAFVSDITGRAKALRCNFVGTDPVASEEAFADTAMNSNYRNRIWAEAHGYWQTGDARGCFSGYSYDASGFTLGYDRVLYPNFAIGMAGAYNDGDYKDKGALAHDSKIESFSAGAYGTYSYPSGVYVTAYGGYTYSDNNIRELRNDPSTPNRVDSWATADFRTETWNAGLNAGYDLRCGGLTITPSVGVNYIQARNSDHSEYLGGVATQKIRDARNRGFYLPAELGVQYDSILSNGGRLRFEVNGAYAYNLRKNGLNGVVDYIDLGAGAGIASPDNTRHSYKLGGGVRYAYCQYDIGARYDYIGKTGYSAHRFSATVGMSF